MSADTTPNMNLEKIDWNKGDGLVPAIVQDGLTHKVLMLGYVNSESLRQTIATGRVTFFSRSRKTLWVKGETSGHFLNLLSWSLDCDSDTVLFQVQADGPTCHLGHISCFDTFTAVSSTMSSDDSLSFLDELGKIIDSRFANPDISKSYVGRLIADGLDRMAQKVGEEAVETVIASKNQDQAEFKGEAADLLFHLMVLLRGKNSSLKEIASVLKARHRPT